MTAIMPPSGTRAEGVHGERETARFVQQMFSRIARRYDFLNHLLSFGLDRRWRQRTALAVAAGLTSNSSRALDLCCGTGDLALELAQVSKGRVVGVDFAHPMLVRAGEKAQRQAMLLSLLEADALRLPFADDSFDVVTVAFGFRNLADYRRGLAEILRVLRPGGQAGILEFALPKGKVFGQLYRLYFRRMLPLIGRVVSGVSGPYSYLPLSVERFPDADEFAVWMEASGFVEVGYEVWTAGTVALHRGSKSAPRPG